MVKSKVLKLELLSIEQTDAFRMAAQTLCRSQRALGAFYRRMQARLGAPKAITAAAHKLARIFYHLWTSGDIYSDPSIDAYEHQYQALFCCFGKSKIGEEALEVRSGIWLNLENQYQQ